ncbi:MAG TPA: DoxX family protein [Allosphingosinicella sp.]|jgi:putative oxidoreductase|nr:DoxX family protein [Allosphingosinicella sp.]
MFRSLSRFEPQFLGVLRIIAGLLFLSHGLVKLIGFPAGAQPGPQPLASLLGVAGVLELVLGGLITVGLFTRPAAFLAAGEMAVAYWMFHGTRSFFPVVNQGEAAILYCFLFLYLTARGPGAFSVEGARTFRRR